MRLNGLKSVLLVEFIAVGLKRSGSDQKRSNPGKNKHTGQNSKNDLLHAQLTLLAVWLCALWLSVSRHFFDLRQG